LLRAAKQLGYERVKVQTNGLFFAYADAVARSVDAGMNEVNLLVKSADPALHDELMGRPGAHALLQQAVANVTASWLHGRLRVEADVLLTARNVDELPSLVASCASRGFAQVNAWLFATSAAEQGGAFVSLVPSPERLRASIRGAVEASKSAGIAFVSLHTPHCMVSPPDWNTTFDPAGMGLFVVDPSARGFLLSESEMERGAWGPGCEGCAVKGPCRGPRREYAALFGDAWVRPFTVEESRGHAASGSTLERAGT